MTTATKKAVVMATRMAEEDEGNGEGSMSNGDGNEKDNCKEESNGK